MGVVESKGSALHVTDSRAMARAESASVISMGAAICCGVMVAIREGEVALEFTGPFTVLYRPYKPEPLEVARACSKRIAPKGLPEILVLLEGFW